MSALARTAAIVEELVDYDGPQLLLLETSKKRRMLATAVQRDKMQEPFFGCEVTDKIYEQYFDQIADLHFAFERALGSRYYFFDLAKVDEKNTVPLQLAKDDEAKRPEYWPQVGFFARSHTTKFNLSKAVGSTKTFKIDGRWGANDFSHFYAKMSNLYALFGVLGRLDDETNSAAERGFIRQTIEDRFWQGGGSYVGFYDSLVARNRTLKLSPLEVARIQYASPGEIALRGNKKSLNEVNELLDVFDDNWKHLSSRYRQIRGALQKEALLSAKPTATFSTPAMKSFVRKEVRKFAEEMKLDRVDEIYDACDQNVLIFTKVILSVFRRADELYTYHAEGRVQRLD
jgi:hypothetical protein